MIIKMKTYSGNITELKENEVFVFGANLDGFHGAGAAGYASFGVFGNVWRNFNYDKIPNGTIGHWNVKGKLGLQYGKNGKSYAIPTITKPGLKRSLKINFKPLFECCNNYPNWIFYYAQEGKTGFNGWTPKEISEMMYDAENIPNNLYIHESFLPYLIKNDISKI